MKIALTSDTVTTSGNNVEFVLGDNGGAFVSLNLMIKQNGNILYQINHDQTYQGSRTQNVPLQPGNYRCSLLIAAYKHGALGITYDSFLQVSKINVATAKGEISTGDDPDFNSVSFQLIVV